MEGLHVVYDVTEDDIDIQSTSHSRFLHITQKVRSKMTRYHLCISLFRVSYVCVSVKCVHVYD